MNQYLCTIALVSALASTQLRALDVPQTLTLLETALSNLAAQTKTIISVVPEKAQIDQLQADILTWTLKASQAKLEDLTQATASLAKRFSNLFTTINTRTKNKTITENILQDISKTLESLDDIYEDRVKTETVATTEEEESESEEEESSAQAPTSETKQLTYSEIQKQLQRAAYIYDKYLQNTDQEETINSLQELANLFKQQEDAILGARVHPEFITPFVKVINRASQLKGNKKQQAAKQFEDMIKIFQYLEDAQWPSTQAKSNVNPNLIIKKITGALPID